MGLDAAENETAAMEKQYRWASLPVFGPVDAELNHPAGRMNISIGDR